jgi:hypothetical protein
MVFWPNVFVSASFKILEIPMYACGLMLGPATRVPAKPLGEDGISNPNPDFETAYNHRHRNDAMMKCWKFGTVHPPCSHHG